MSKKKLKMCFCGILPTASGYVILYPNLMTLRAEGRNHLIKEKEKLKHSSRTKNAAANKVNTRRPNFLKAIFQKFYSVHS